MFVTSTQAQRLESRVPATYLTPETTRALIAESQRRIAERREKSFRAALVSVRFGNDRRATPRIIGFDKVWTMEQRLAETHMKASANRFAAEPVSFWGSPA